MRAASLAMLLVASAAPAAFADEIPRPEHPNPQFQRDEWQNLNGSWDFWEGDAADEKSMAARADFPDKIVVPFCRESKLSGLGRTGFVKNVLYRRRFSVPKEWGIGEAGAAGGEASKSGARLLVHIGACDWRTTVWVDGVKVGFHEGASTPIDCDVTDALAAGSKDGSHELRVWAFDDTASGLQQLGKQCPKEKSYGCLYTRTTGIWQTVWMERVGSAWIDGVDFGADANFENLLVTPRVRGSMDADAVGVGLFVRVSTPAGEVGHAQIWNARAGSPATVKLSSARPWSPSDPFLYDVEIDLLRIGLGDHSIPMVQGALDSVRSYVGLRRLERRDARVLVNGLSVFQRLILDQGFYPEGIWTAPSDAALKRDIEMSMAAGFNGARLHQKVFEPRFLYWADKLGYLVWGEAPSWGANYANPAVDRVVLDEWRAEVERDRNHPSLVGWCPFNETDATPGRLQNAATALTRALDPTRPVLDTSGYVHSDPRRDVDDAHDYDQDPKSFRARWWPRAADASLARYGIVPRDRPFFVSEFGGIGWLKPGDPGWSYGDAPKSEAEWFTRFEGLCDAQLENPSLFGFCYTQLTDVEQERNGLYYYDRTPKFDVKRLHAIVSKRAAIESEAPPAAKPLAGTPANWKVLLPAHVDAPEKTWRFVALEKPLAEDVWRGWNSESVSELGGVPVASGRPAFGSKGGFEALIGTPWKTSELYLLRTIEFDGAPFGSAQLVMHFDNAVEVRLNGELLFEKGGWNDAYDLFDVSERARTLLKRGANVLTVHVHQDSGGQFFDAALLVAPLVPPAER